MKNKRLSIKEIKWIKSMQQKAHKCNLLPIFIKSKNGKIKECHLYTYGGFLDHIEKNDTDKSKG